MDKHVINLRERILSHRKITDGKISSAVTQAGRGFEWPPVQNNLCSSTNDLSLLKCGLLNYITLKLQCCCLTLITTEENEYVSSVADGNQKILSDTGT